VDSLPFIKPLINALFLGSLDTFVHLKENKVTDSKLTKIFSEPVGKNGNNVLDKAKKREDQEVVRLLEKLGVKPKFVVPPKRRRKEFKVIIVGESGVGKTSLLCQYVDQEFPPKRSRNNFSKSETVRGETVQLNISIIDYKPPASLDNPPNESQYSADFRGAHCIIAVYAINEINSFEKCSSFWLKEMLSDGQNPMRFLIGNKMDLEDRKVTKEQGEDQVQKNTDECKFHCFWECSATDFYRARVNEIFKEIAQLLRNYFYPN